MGNFRSLGYEINARLIILRADFISKDSHCITEYVTGLSHIISNSEDFDDVILVPSGLELFGMKSSFGGFFPLE